MIYLLICVCVTCCVHCYGIFSRRGEITIKLLYSEVPIVSCADYSVVVQLLYSEVPIVSCADYSVVVQLCM